MPSAADALTLDALACGEVALKGKFSWGSNYTFLVEVAHAGGVLKAVYKPTRGERPLWDFPAQSLARRETAAYLVSEALEWGLVPETVYRKKAPLGPGSLQRFIEHDPEYHFFNFTPEDRQRLRPVALFDLLVNNADRKGGHLIVDDSRRIWLIDHGICFHVEDKLRTVIWDFAGEPIPAELLAPLETLVENLKPGAPLALALKARLNRGEVKALAARARSLLKNGVFPYLDPHRRPFPWPPV